MKTNYYPGGGNVGANFLGTPSIHPAAPSSGTRVPAKSTCQSREREGSDCSGAWPCRNVAVIQAEPRIACRQHLLSLEISLISVFLMYVYWSLDGS